MKRIPTDEEIIKEIRAIFKVNPAFKQCCNCAKFCPITHVCDKFKRRVLPNVPGCNFHEAAEEKMLLEARRNLETQARENEKMDFLLAVAITSANMTTLFLEDLETRIKKVRKSIKDKQDSRALRKDLDLAEQIHGAMSKITKSLEEIRGLYNDMITSFSDSIEKPLSDIESQYRNYVQSHVDKLFSKGGKYNAQAHDQFHEDAAEFATFLLEFARVVHHNEQNAIELYEYMHSKANKNAEGKENSFCLDDKDINKYKLKY